VTTLNREQILEAIRAWGAENGKAPGKGAFEQCHDVPGSAFGGMYWARWSDAVREAGLQPLDSPAAITEVQVLSAIASLVREIGRYPTIGEMKMAKQRNASFPSRDVVQKRLGSRASQVARLVGWCSAQPDMTDVLAVLDSEAAGRGSGEDDRPASEQVEGYVYMLESDGLFKIGMTQSVPRRWAQIAGGAPGEVELVHYLRTDDPSGIERYWHQRFESVRMGGEWFALSVSDVRAFKRRARFM
jgi:hypothetical protein